MMTIWILQTLINLLLLVVAVQWMLARKRIARLEAALRRLTIARASTQVSEQMQQKSQTKPGAAINNNASVSTGSRVVQNASMAAVPVAQGAPIEAGTLIERAMAPEQGNGSTGDRGPGRLSPTELAAAYDYADQLLGRGVSMQDVAKKTGLSLAELRLVAKMAGRSARP